MRKREAAFEEHFSKVAEAQFVAQAPDDDQEHDIGEKLEVVKPYPED
ncbi:MAG: hypothetical protein NVS2B7_08580 [Herpetosiphon sp.]